VKATVCLILAETYRELEDEKNYKNYKQTLLLTEAFGKDADIVCAYCDEQIDIDSNNDWQMEYRTCLNKSAPHVFHGKCVHGLKAPFRGKHEKCVCCFHCVEKEKNFEFLEGSASDKIDKKEA
jgi:hypothetical protein